jgi:hypothetical protein
LNKRKEKIRENSMGEVGKWHNCEGKSNVEYII